MENRETILAEAFILLSVSRIKVTNYRHNSQLSAEIRSLPLIERLKILLFFLLYLHERLLTIQTKKLVCLGQ